MSEITKRAAGYNTGINQVMRFVRTPKVLKQAMYNYECASKATMFARQDYINEEDLICGSEVIYPFLKDDSCGDLTDDDFYSNERPDDLDLNLTRGSVKICKTYALEHKVSLRDKMFMCDSWDMYTELLGRKLALRQQRITDHYFWRTIAAQAAKDNIQGIAPNGTITPIDVKTAAGIEQIVLTAITTMGKKEIICDNGSKRDTLLFALPWCAYEGLYRYFKEMNICCDSNVRETGIMPTPLGFSFHFVKNLPKTNGVTIGMWVDVTKVGFPHNWLYLKWSEVKRDLWLVGDFVYDAYVLDPNGVGLFYVTGQ